MFKDDKVPNTQSFKNYKNAGRPTEFPLGLRLNPLYISRKFRDSLKQKWRLKLFLTWAKNQGYTMVKLETNARQGANLKFVGWNWATS